MEEGTHVLGPPRTSDNSDSTPTGSGRHQPETRRDEEVDGRLSNGINMFNIEGSEDGDDLDDYVASDPNLYVEEGSSDSGNDSTAGERTSFRQKSSKKPKTTKKKKKSTKEDETKVRTIKPLDVDKEILVGLVKQNPSIMKVFHALYVHRRLTLYQIHRLFFQNNISLPVLRVTMYRWTRYRVFEREYLFLLSKVKSEPTIHYSLSPLGARLYAEACMDVVLFDEAVDDLEDKPQQHYLYEDLAVVKQDVHHFILQTFITELIGHFWQQGVFLPSCEAKRYYYLNDLQKAKVDPEGVPYKPDWVIFKPNDYFDRLVRNDYIGLDILSVPISSREEDDLTTLKEYYMPSLSVEADNSTMSVDRLHEKFDRMLKVLPHIPKCVIFTVGEGPYGKQRIEFVPKRPKENKRRLFTIAKAAEKVIGNLLLDDEFTVLVGRDRNLLPTSYQYIEHNENLRESFELPEGWWKEWFPSYSPMTEQDFNRLSIKTGTPDLALKDEATEKMIVIFLAMPCWVNPQVRVNQFEHIPDLERILLYPFTDDFERDAQIVRGDVLYMALEDILQNRKVIYKKDHDRSGVYWRPDARWTF